MAVRPNADHQVIVDDAVIISGAADGALVGRPNRIPGVPIEVPKELQIGISGSTGMAFGDHVHFSMLVAGYQVDPKEWWDEHWIHDRI